MGTGAKVVSCLSLSLSLHPSPVYPLTATRSSPGEPAGEKFLLLRINGIVCLALTRRSYRDRQTIFFLLEITREALAGLAGQAAAAAAAARLRGLRNRVAGRLRGGGRACALREIRADLSTQGTAGRSRPGGSEEPLKCKRKEREKEMVEEEIVGMK